MKLLLNLRLATRLGIAFGALAAGLLVVAFVAITATGSLRDDSEDLARHDLATAQLIGKMGERSQQTGSLAAQHLYVYDGDLERQDAVARVIADNRKRNDADFETLESAIDGEALQGLFERYAAVRGAFAAP